MTLIHLSSRGRVAMVAIVLILAATAGDARGQPTPRQTAVPSEHQTLRDRVTARYDVLPIRNGLVLTPRSRIRDVRSVEVSDGSIAVNGTVVTGAELRERLGADADLVLQLSYLDTETRRTLFTGAPAPPEKPAEIEQPPASEPPVSPRAPSRGRAGGTKFRLGGSVTVAPEEVVSDVVVIGGMARIEGEVRENVVVVGGAAELGPHAIVGEDVTVVGGTLTRDPGAEIHGEVNEIAVGSLPFDIGRLDRRHRPFGPFTGGFLGPARLMMTIFRGILLCLLICLVLIVAPKHIDRVAEQASDAPLKSGLIGVLAELLLLPVLLAATIILIVTIIGIPLLVLIPFTIIAVLIVLLTGFAGVATRVGGWLGGRLGSGIPGPYLAAVLGIVLLLTPTLVGRLIGLPGGIFSIFALILIGIGIVVEYAAWTVGFGAALLVTLGPRLKRRAAVRQESTPAPPPESAEP